MIALIDALVGLLGQAALKLVVFVFALAVGGCASSQRPWPADPMSLTAPYRAANGGDLVWAVAPLSNESGVSVADELRITDRLVEEIRQTSGLTALPLNRTIEAMRAAELPSIDSPEQARTLARRMGVDAIVVGTLTAWGPYEPPEIGITLALYPAAPDAMRSGAAPGLIDPFELTKASRGPVTIGANAARTDTETTALSEVSAHLSGVNGAVRERVKAYGTGRADPNSATGWRGYFTSMSRFERFAAFEMVRLLLEEERRRLRIDAPASTATSDTTGRVLGLASSR